LFSVTARGTTTPAGGVGEAVGVDVDEGVLGTEDEVAGAAAVESLPPPQAASKNGASASVAAKRESLGMVVDSPERFSQKQNGISNTFLSLSHLGTAADLCRQ
jgi:hypothetical protein